MFLPTLTPHPSPLTPSLSCFVLMLPFQFVLLQFVCFSFQLYPFSVSFISFEFSPFRVYLPSVFSIAFITLWFSLLRVSPFSCQCCVYLSSVFTSLEFSSIASISLQFSLLCLSSFSFSIAIISLRFSMLRLSPFQFSLLRVSLCGFLCGVYLVSVFSAALSLVGLFLSLKFSQQLSLAVSSPFSFHGCYLYLFSFCLLPN